MSLIRFCYNCRAEKVFNTNLDEDCLRCVDCGSLPYCSFSDYQRAKGLKSYSQTAITQGLKAEKQRKNGKGRKSLLFSKKELKGGSLDHDK